MNDFVHSLENIDIETVEARRLALLWMMTDDNGKLIFEGLNPHDKALFKDGGFKTLPFTATDDQIYKYKKNNNIHLPRTGLMVLCNFDHGEGYSYSMPFVINPWFCFTYRKNEEQTISATRQIQYMGVFIVEYDNGHKKVLMGDKLCDDFMVKIAGKIFHLLSGPRSCVKSITREYGLFNNDTRAESIVISTEANTIMLDMPDQRIAKAVSKVNKIMKPNDDLPSIHGPF